MNKWKNYGLWTSLATLGGLILCGSGKVDVGEYQTWVTTVLGVATALGIVSNPSKGMGFKDEKEGEIIDDKNMYSSRPWTKQ